MININKFFYCKHIYIYIYIYLLIRISTYFIYFHVLFCFPFIRVPKSNTIDNISQLLGKISYCIIEFIITSLTKNCNKIDIYSIIYIKKNKTFIETFKKIKFSFKSLY